MEPSPSSQPALLSLQPDDPVHQALTRIATAQARAALDKDVELEPQAVDRSGHWALVRARLCETDGGTLSLQGTRFADAAGAGGVSDLAVVLFRLQGDPDLNEWKVVDQAILPTDVAWLAWPREHGAPAQLLGISG